MKIFNRGSDNKQPAVATPVGPAALAAPAPVPAAPAAPVAPAAPAPDAAAPAAPPAPDLAVILDANVKEMSEKIARLASTLEGSTTERSTFEAKLEQMEERMRKLSSLTEMISAQYNPFVGDAPAEREPLPHPEVGLASPADATLMATLPPPAAPALSLSLEPPAPEPPAPVADPLPLDAPPAVLEGPPTGEPAQLDAEVDERHPLLPTIAPGFESSMLLLGWADMLLKSAGSRASLLDLANYYHTIGWIGDEARSQLLAYADGLVLDPEWEDAADWRANVEVHEKSLLFVEKLKAVAGRK